MRADPVPSVSTRQTEAGGEREREREQLERAFVAKEFAEGIPKRKHCGRGAGSHIQSMFYLCNSNCSS